MNYVMLIFGGLFTGILFGFALEKGRVLDPEVIVGQFQFRKWLMMKMFLSAIITGLVIFSVFFTLGFERLSWKIMILSTDIIGGLLLGAGAALAGACPGTVFAQIGAGYKDAYITLVGAIAGALAYVWVKPVILNLVPVWPNQLITLETLMNQPFWVIALLLVIIMILLLIGLEKLFPWRKEKLSI